MTAMSLSPDSSHSLRVSQHSSSATGWTCFPRHALCIPTCSLKFFLSIAAPSQSLISEMSFCDGRLRAAPHRA